MTHFKKKRTLFSTPKLQNLLISLARVVPFVPRKITPHLGYFGTSPCIKTSPVFRSLLLTLTALGSISLISAFSFRLS